MVVNAFIQKLCKCSVNNCEDIGAITFATAINKFEKPAISDLIRYNIIGHEAQASEMRTTRETVDFHENDVQDNEQVTVRLRRYDAMKNHFSWLQNKQVKPWNERVNWAPSGSDSKKVEDIIWGQTSVSPSLTTHEVLPELVFYDETHSGAFEQALEIQDQSSSSLSYLELDVKGCDAHSTCVRIQRACEVKLGFAYEPSEKGNKIGKTTMELKRILTIWTLDASSIPPVKSNAEDLYQDIVKQLAQHEVDKALDERNHYLREVFREDVDHVRSTQQNTVVAHEWSYQKPEACIRGPDGTMMTLTETRTDFANGGEVVLTHTISIEQSKGEARKDRLFDLPTQGSEIERRIRQARWSISSAIDKCNASCAADAFAVHNSRKMHGSCLPLE